ncbi:MAG TPA: diguanylate cyclase [Thermoanaerobaculia bacterium]|nr:diguanylate cyclase [Thermoanaerobaculia bacterium]
MCRRSAPRLCRSLAAVLALTAMAAPRAAAETSERGFPLVQAIQPTVPETEIQNFDVAADPRGLVYVANLGGLLVWDGARWLGLPIGIGETAFSVRTDERGRVAVGGVDEIGLLEPGANGALTYTSLVPKLPPDAQPLGQIGGVEATAEGFVFLTDSRLLHWDGSTLATVTSYSPDRPFEGLFRVDDSVYFWGEAGLFRLVGRRLEMLPGGEVFRNRRIDFLQAAGGGLLVSVRGEGLFLFVDGVASPFAPEASRWAREKRLFCGARLPDGRWVLGSILGGILLLSPNGTVDQVIDTSVGLPDDLVYAVSLDHEGSLWLALNNGLAKVEVSSPLSVIDRRAGLSGAVYQVMRHRGTLWAAGAAGLFVMEPTRPPVAFRQVPEVPPSAWSLLSLGEELLIGALDGVYLHTGGPPQRIAGTEDQTAFLLQRSRRDPARVWVGTDDGLFALRREPDGWRYEGVVPGAPRDLRTLEEGEGGMLWCGSQLDGVVGLESPVPGGPAAPRRVVGEPGAVYLYRVADRIVAVRDDKVMRLDEEGATLVEDEALAPLSGHGDYTLIAEDAHGDLWLNTRPPAIALAQGRGWRPELRSLDGLPLRSFESAYAEADGTVWLAGDNGLYRWTGEHDAETTELPAPLVAQIRVGGDAIFHGLAPGAAPGAVRLPADLRRLRIELAPRSFRPGLRFQTRLDPVDTDWSAPTSEPFAELTRLPPGAYTFRARTVSPLPEVSPEAEWSFSVRSPWYLAPWALALWAGLGIVGVRGYSRLRHRALAQRAEQLERRVAEQTEELRRTLGELERANARLQELSLKDDLTGVANRRHLQQVLDEEWSRCRRHRRPIAFVLLDLDLFKLLNDTKGHHEGDLSLRAVALYLARHVQRSGDLVARYGGEEFSVLLPDTELAGALTVAEGLRRGIEDLALPHEATALGRVTASFGVAAMVPLPGVGPEVLVQAADAALYRAKNQGRNRVCAAGEKESLAPEPPDTAPPPEPLPS